MAAEESHLKGEKFASSESCDALASSDRHSELDLHSRHSPAFLPHYDLKMMAFMGKSLPPQTMKKWRDESESDANFLLNDVEKELAKDLPPRFFKHVTPVFPPNLCRCKSESVPDFSVWKPKGARRNKRQSALFRTDGEPSKSFSAYTRLPTFEELKAFSDGFRMPKKWNLDAEQLMKKRQKAAVVDEMDVYQLRLAERSAETKDEYVSNLKFSFSQPLPRHVLPGQRKRADSASRLFGVSSASVASEKESASETSDYCEIMEEGVRYIKYGTLPKILFHLVEFLTSTNSEQKKAGQKMFFAFVNAYRRLETSSAILSWLKETYLMENEEAFLDLSSRDNSAEDNVSRLNRRLSSAPPRSGKEGIVAFKQGILCFLLTWLEHRFVPDFTTPYMEGQSKKTPLYGELLQFIKDMSPGHQIVVKKVLDQESQDGVGVQHSASDILGVSRVKLDEKRSESPKGSLRVKEKVSRSSFFNVMGHRSQKLPARFSFLDLHPEEVSELLTAEDSRLFSNVNVDEFAGKAWTPKLDSGIGVLTHRWNKLGRWVASEIVNNDNLKQRVEILKRLITIMDMTFKDSNFFTTMAIISGLNHSAVKRMKRTWRTLPEKYSKDLSLLEEELSFSQSFRRYRELLTDAIEKEKPCIPFLAVHTKDMLFITEAKGNPDWVSEGVLNFEKLNLIGTIVHQMKACQKFQFKYQVVVGNPSRHETIKNFIGRLPNTLPEESLYSTSVAHEGKNESAHDV